MPETPFCPRQGPARWSDVGMYLQTVMLLLRAEGTHSCAQTASSVCPKTVAEVLSPPDELIASAACTRVR